MGVCCGAEGIRTPDPLTASPKDPIPTGHGQSSRVTGSSPLPGGSLRHDPSPSQQVTSGFASDSGQIVDTSLSDVVHVDADGVTLLVGPNFWTTRNRGSSVRLHRSRSPRAPSATTADRSLDQPRTRRHPSRPKRSRSQIERLYSPNITSISTSPRFVPSEHG